VDTGPGGQRGHPESAPQQDTHSELSGSAGNVVQARDVSGGVHFHSQAHAPGPRPAQLPGDVRGFVNRVHELDELDAALLNQAAEPGLLCVAVIVGTAGVGKTSLALRWSHRTRSRFPDGQLYVNLRGYDPGAPVAAVEVLGRFLRALNVPTERIPAGEESRTELFRSTVAERRMLIVLDNAATVEQIRPLLPGASQCLIVVTSRSRMSGLVARDGAHRVNVETLSGAESVELLRRVLAAYRTDDDEADLAELARLCAHLPLALRIAAERAALRPRMPLSELIADLRDESGLWEALSAEDAGEADAVRTVFAWSYRSLAPQAARMFRLLGLHPGPEFGPQAAAALAAITPVQARRLLDTLAGTHLLEECGHDRYQFHDLLRAYAVDQVQQEESEGERWAAQDRVLGWYLHSAAAAAQTGSGAYTLPVIPEPLVDGVTVPTFGDYKAAIAWYETERDNLVSAARAASSVGMHRVAWQIPAVLTMIIADRDSADTWLPAQYLALDAAHQAGDRYGEAITLDNLGIAHRHLFNLTQSTEYFSAALTAFQDIGDRFGQARAANGLGVVHLFAHRIDDALACFERALEVARELGRHAFVGFFTRNVGWALLERGDVEQAEPLLRQAAAALREAGEHLEVAEALTLLASALRRSGRPVQARDAVEQALAIASELDSTLFEALGLLELGRIELAQRCADEALAHLQQAAALFWRTGRPDLQAAAWSGTGEAYLLAGRAEDAADFHRRAAATYRARGDQWQLALALTNLADALNLGGETVQAREHRREAVRLLAEFSDPLAEEKRAQLNAALTDE
jgi:tetratricopeptide (TPR) repeat protein